MIRNWSGWVRIELPLIWVVTQIVRRTLNRIELEQAPETASGTIIGKMIVFLVTPCLRRKHYMLNAVRVG